MRLNDSREKESTVCESARKPIMEVEDPKPFRPIDEVRDKSIPIPNSDHLDVGCLAKVIANVRAPRIRAPDRIEATIVWQPAVAVSR